MEVGRVVLVLSMAVAVFCLQGAWGSHSRRYHSLTLENGIRVLLVSDRHTSRAAASIDVGIGSWSDPEKIPGLAHFLEHMLFLGTKKYPAEGEYRRYLSSHAGLQNAYTIYENTNFFFAVSSHYLPGALDRFAQFFIAPTLKKSASQREMKAVDSEFRKRINSDYLRSRQVLMTVANPKHPYHRFTTGTIDTLNISGIHESLVDFHEKYYSSNLMTLVVLGRDPLDRLEQLVRRSFSAVPNKNLKRPTVKVDAFPVPSFTGIKVLMEPLGVQNTVYLYWPLPSLDKYHRENPIYYFAWLIGHEGSGSILSALKRRQWGTFVYAGPGLQTTDLWQMQIRLYLTGKGLAHLDDVVSLVFQYIRFILREGVLHRIYEEQHQLRLLNYKYQPKTSPYSFVKIISRNMQTIHNPQDYRQPPTRSLFNPALIRAILRKLSPERLLLFASSPQYKSPSFRPKLDQTEQWYGTRYNKQKIPASTMKRWRTDPISQEFHIPDENPYVPRNLKVLPYPHCTRARNPSLLQYFIRLRNERCSFAYPQNLHNDEGLELWWKRELNFRTPKIYVDILLGTPYLSRNQKEAAAALLFRHLLLSQINKNLYPSRLAGFGVQVSTPLSGVEIKLHGYSYHEAVYKLLETVLAGLKSYEVRTTNETWFSSSRRRTSASLSGFGSTQQVFKHIKGYYENLVLQKTFFRHEDLAKTMLGLSGEDVRNIIRKALSRIHLTMFVYGNANQPEAMKYAYNVLGIIRGKTRHLMPRDGVPRQRHLYLPPGSNVAFRVKGPNAKDVNNGLNAIFQIGPSCNSGSKCDSREGQCNVHDVKDFVLSRAVAYFMRAACFSQLRTKEQLGYIVFCYPSKSNGISSVHFIIQSNRYSPQYLLSRVEAFIKTFMTTLRDKVFNRRQWNRATLIGTSVAMSNGHSMVWRDKKYWKSIAAGSCKFKRLHSARQVYAYLRYQPTEAFRFYEKYFANKNTRKLLAVELYGKGTTLSTTPGRGQKVVTEETLSDFKKSSEYYPAHTD